MPCLSCPSITPTGDSVFATGIHLSKLSLTSGPDTDYKDVLYAAFSDYSQHCLGLSPPPLRTVSWSHTWRITALEFDDDLSSSQTPTSATHWFSFGEFTRAILGIHLFLPLIHVALCEKTHHCSTFVI